MTTPERQLEDQLIGQLRDLKYEYRADIRDRASLEKNFREKFEALNHVHLTEGEFQRLLDEIVTPDVFTAAHTLRNRNSFTRDDGTPLNYTLVKIDDWCKNTFEVVSQLRINTDYSHHRYDVILLINGIPAVQIELKTLGIKGKRQNQLTDEHIKRIIETYQHRKQHERYSRRVKMKEIEANDFNLNISRYVSTSEAEVEIDLAATHAELVAIDQSIEKATARHNEFLKELGLPPLP